MPQKVTPCPTELNPFDLEPEERNDPNLLTPEESVNLEKSEHEKSRSDKNNSNSNRQNS